MAYEIPGFSFTRVAGQNLTGSQYCAVDIEHGTGDAVLPSAGGRAIGVVQNKPDDGQAATIVVSGVTKAWIGATGVAAGDNVTVASTGKIVQATSGDRCIGVALEDNASGELGTILLLTNATVTTS